MSTKVKRGLGLLVIAVIGVVLGLVADEISTSAEPVSVALTLIAIVMFFGGLVAGLVLLAWGLLRD